MFDIETGNIEAEGDGDSSSVGKVTKQLEQQVLQEKEEDAEEGVPLPTVYSLCKVVFIVTLGLYCS